MQILGKYVSSIHNIDNRNWIFKPNQVKKEAKVQGSIQAARSVNFFQQSGHLLPKVKLKNENKSIDIGKKKPIDEEENKPINEKKDNEYDDEFEEEENTKKPNKVEGAKKTEKTKKIEKTEKTEKTEKKANDEIDEEIAEVEVEVKKPSNK
jgi:hypothetical protein